MTERNQIISDWLASTRKGFPPMASIMDEFPKIEWSVRPLRLSSILNKVCPICDGAFLEGEWLIAEPDEILNHTWCYVEEHRNQQPEA